MEQATSGSWKLTLPCNRAEAEAIAAADESMIALDPPPVLVTTEPDPAQPDAWRLDAYFDREPEAIALAFVRSLVPSCTIAPAVAPVVDEDWLVMSQSGLEPIRAGRFFVFTSAYAGTAPPGGIAFEIEAGRAFGTGHHETTSGCLEALDKLAIDPFQNIADIGTGTGLLAFAAHRLWPEACVVASDIDPVSIEVSTANAAINGIALGEAPGQVALSIADGLDAPLLQARAPYDLIVANILAGPLIVLAPAFSKALAAGGTLILAGLLENQADAVEAAYREVSLQPRQRLQRGDWPTLVLRKP